MMLRGGAVLLLTLCAAACDSRAGEEQTMPRDTAAAPAVEPSQDVTPPGAAARTFQCGDLRINVALDAGAAFVELPDRTLNLPMTEPGTQYSDGQSTLRMQSGGTVSLELPEGTYPDCQEVPPGDMHTGG